MSEKIEKLTRQQSRKWLITINHPIDKGLDHDVLVETTMLLGADYFCLADEIGNESHVYHTHIFIYRHSPIRFDTLKEKYPGAHIDKAYGTAQQNRDYVRKEGRWAETSKHETSVPNTFFEYGVLPEDDENDSSTTMKKIRKMIIDGKTDTEIINEVPFATLSIKKIDEARQTLLFDHFKDVNRDVIVTYIYGDTGVGKTSSIFGTYGAKNICRVTSYKPENALFDSYSGQDILVFDEFNYKYIRIGEMLMWLDKYPVELPARYYARTACFTKVFILSNIEFEEQYKKQVTPEQYKAFQRRIQNVICMRFIDGKRMLKTEKGVWINGNAYNDFTVFETGNE